MRRWPSRRRKLFWPILHLLSFSPFLMGGPESSSQKEKEEKRSTEERLARLEERLGRLEQTLNLVLERLSDPALESQVNSALESMEDLAIEVREVAPISRMPSNASSTSSELVSRQNQDVDSTGPTRIPYGGYMEMHLNHDNINPTVLDFHRFVLLFGHQFDDRIGFTGELELEHALVEGGEASGELELEQAYLDFLLFPNLSFRAGMMLVPVGIINERHEPASFNGVERPFVDSLIIPSTWFSSGAGVVGDLGHGFSFKAFTMSSLNAALFSAGDGFRNGRQKGFFDNASNMAFSGRLEWAGMPNLNLGTSFWTGNAGLEFTQISGLARILEFDGQFSWDRFDLRGEFAQTNLDQAAEINRSLQLIAGVNPNIAEEMRGFYLEGALHLLPSTFSHDMVAFYRYENFDTQFTMPAGFLPLKQFDRSAHLIGATYFPHSDIALKIDYNFMRNESSVIRIPNRWNFGIGWWF